MEWLFSSSPLEAVSPLSEAQTAVPATGAAVPSKQAITLIEVDLQTASCPPLPSAPLSLTPAFLLNGTDAALCCPGPSSY